MLPGPDQIIACPRCKGLGKYMTLMSGNTFGARYWTDGKQFAPMLLRPPAVVKCHHCGKYYWLADAEEVGKVDSQSDVDKLVDPNWASAEGVREPDEEGYYEAIDTGLAVEPTQERMLRILAWWRGNDASREAPRPQVWDKAPISVARRENLRSLAGLLHDGDEADCLMKAEVLRELGDFDSAMELLRTASSRKYGGVVRQLMSMCEGKDMYVRELSFGK